MELFGGIDEFCFFIIRIMGFYVLVGLVYYCWCRFGWFGFFLFCVNYLFFMIEMLVWFWLCFDLGVGFFECNCFWWNICDCDVFVGGIMVWNGLVCCCGSEFVDGFLSDGFCKFLEEFFRNRVDFIEVWIGGIVFEWCLWVCLSCWCIDIYWRLGCLDDWGVFLWFNFVDNCFCFGNFGLVCFECYF